MSSPRDLKLSELYSQLLTLWRNEWKSSALQELDSDFNSQFSHCYSKAEIETELKSDVDLAKVILIKINTLYEDLLKLRAKKILTLLLNGHNVPKKLLTSNEVIYRDDLLKALPFLLEKHPISTSENLAETLDGQESTLITSNEKGVSAKKTSGTVESLEDSSKEDSSFKILRFDKQIPAFIGIDGNNYGPFKPQDIATIPNDNAKALISKQVAFEIEMYSKEE